MYGFYLGYSAQLKITHDEYIRITGMTNGAGEENVTSEAVRGEKSKGLNIIKT